MIRLHRERSQQTVRSGFRGSTRIRRERELLERRLQDQKPRSRVWKSAKDQLKVESGGKCGYCEGKAAHVAHGDVEHYRPKSVYWWLAYCYDNFIYSCQICNQTYKGAHFPLLGTALAPPNLPADASDAFLDQLAGTLAPDPLDSATVQQFGALAAGEKAEIPDPYFLDPEELFSWRADEVLGEVEIRPRDGSPRAQQAFLAARNFLGLNRDELKRWRWEVYGIAESLAQALQSDALEDELEERIKSRLRRMMSVEGEFSGMVRFLVRDTLGLAL